MSVPVCLLFSSVSSAFLVGVISPLVAAHRKQKATAASQNLARVGKRGSAIQLAQRAIGRSCARSRPMRIFPIACVEYDRFVFDSYATPAQSPRSVQNRAHAGARLSVNAQAAITRPGRFSLQRAKCANPARTCTKRDHVFSQRLTPVQATPTCRSSARCTLPPRFPVRCDQPRVVVASGRHRA